MIECTIDTVRDAQYLMQWLEIIAVSAESAKSSLGWVNLHGEAALTEKGAAALDAALERMGSAINYMGDWCQWTGG